MPAVLVRLNLIATRVVGCQGSNRQKGFLLSSEFSNRTGLAEGRHRLSIYRKQLFEQDKYTAAMANNISNFGINADDVPRARRFYEQVFGWTFQPWGPPNFSDGRTRSALSLLVNTPTSSPSTEALSTT